MGEVGSNATDECHDLKLNGNLNGNTEDEQMDGDAKNRSEISIEAMPKSVNKDESVNVNEINKTKPDHLSDVSIVDGTAEKKSANGSDGDNNGKVHASTIATVDDDDDAAVILDSSTETNQNDDSISDTKSNSSGKTLSNGDNTKSTSIAAAMDAGNVVRAAHNSSEEIHAISDSDDDEDTTKRPSETIRPTSSTSGLKIQNLSMQKTNGVNNNSVDDDKPVSIHSDSDTENDKNEVHEILSDKEDCVVIEDDQKTSASDSVLRGNIRSGRKSAVRPREITAYDEDIEEIIDDPLEIPQSKKARLCNTNTYALPISIQEAHDLSMGNKSKDPTLIIIDTNNRNSVTSGVAHSTVQALNKQNVSVLPVGLPAQGVYPMNMQASITPVSSQNSSKIATGISSALPNATAASPLINAPVLTSLTDDMFVLEAPSFIVPYIYEKPPSQDLRQIVEKISVELEEQRKKSKEAEKEAKTDDKVKHDGKESEEDKEDESKSEKDGEKSKNKSKKKKVVKNADDSWDESDTSTDDEASDSESRTKVLIKEAKTDLDTITPMISNQDPLNASSDEKKDANNYFESPLGKFFMDIGVNLVQEHVQTDLLRQQKRKLNREGAQASPSIQMAINSLMKNLEMSKSKNEVFKFETKRCEYCNFKSESSLVMAHHYETPHMKGTQYKCNFCWYEVKTPYDILFHMKNEHSIQARVEKALSYHQCPNCMFEDNGKSKLARHAVVCSKKFRPEVNLAPPVDWEPPAKIPRIKPRHGLVGTANAYQVKYKRM